MRLWPAMRAQAGDEEYASPPEEKLYFVDRNRAWTVTEVSTDLQDMYSSTKAIIDAQNEYQIEAIADREIYAANMASILAFLEWSARACDQYPLEILYNLVQDPEDALGRERRRTQLQTSYENARALVAANEGMVARVRLKPREQRWCGS